MVSETEARGEELDINKIEKCEFGRDERNMKAALLPSSGKSHYTKYIDTVKVICAKGWTKKSL